MTFLQPYILWGLPLILLPVLIHLFNRLRHRSMPWAAMMFLRSATRKSTRYARLKQFLILLFRVLAVLGLVLALTRPLAGGWMGWMLGGAPDVILVLLDRSASMDTRTSPAVEATKRAEAVSLLARSSERFSQDSRVVLIESAIGDPLEVPAGSLEALPLTRGTDTAADLPTMMQRALDWFIEQRPGSGELWIASDLQASNWHPESERWGALASGFEALPQSVRVRLMALNQEAAENLSLSVISAEPRLWEGEWELDLVFEITRQQGSMSEVPVSLVINQARSQLDLRLEGPRLRYRQRVPLGPELTAGWGYLALPVDGNGRDNRSYFVFGPRPPLVTAVLAEADWARGVLSLAAAPDPGDTNQLSRLMNPQRLEGERWVDYALVLWQGPLGPAGQALEEYVREGGVVLCFPPAGSESWAGLGWGQVESAEAQEPFRVASWDRQDGPLADSEEGLPLYLEGLTVSRRHTIAGEASVLASYGDGEPFLVRRSLDRGQIYFCSAGLGPDWSNLAEGTVLVPMIQRLLREGAKRFQQQQQLEAGFLVDNAARWTVLDAAEGKDPQTDAGIYRSGGQLLAVNRPDQEDDPTLVEPERAKALFGNLATQLFEERSGAGRLQSELWRFFLLAMAAFLLVEGILILPERRRRAGSGPGLVPGVAAGQKAEEVLAASHHG